MINQEDALSPRNSKFDAHCTDDCKGFAGKFHQVYPALNLTPNILCCCPHTVKLYLDLDYLESSNPNTRFCRSRDMSTFGFVLLLKNIGKVGVHCK